MRCTAAKNSRKARGHPIRFTDMAARRSVDKLSSGMPPNVMIGVVGVLIACQVDPDFLEHARREVFQQ